MPPIQNRDDQSLLRKFFDEYNEALHFLGVTALFFAIFQIIYFQLFLHSQLFYEYLEFCGEVSTALLTLIGEEVRLVRRTITSPTGAAVTIVEGCDALRIYSVLVAAIIAFDSSIKNKVIGVVLGVALMFIFNAIRISMLLWLDVHFTELFDLFHHTILPFGLWVIAMLYFYLWGSRVQGLETT